MNVNPKYDTFGTLANAMSSAALGAAERHLKQMEYYKHAKNESVFGSFLKKAPIAESIRTAAIKLFNLF